MKTGVKYRKWNSIKKRLGIKHNDIVNYETKVEQKIGLKEIS